MHPRCPSPGSFGGRWARCSTWNIGVGGQGGVPDVPAETSRIWTQHPGCPTHSGVFHVEHPRLEPSARCLVHRPSHPELEPAAAGSDHRCFCAARHPGPLEAIGQDVPRGTSESGPRGSARCFSGNISYPDPAYQPAHPLLEVFHVEHRSRGQGGVPDVSAETSRNRAPRPRLPNRLSEVFHVEHHRYLVHRPCHPELEPAAGSDHRCFCAARHPGPLEAIGQDVPRGTSESGVKEECPMFQRKHLVTGSPRPRLPNRLFGGVPRGTPQARIFRPDAWSTALATRARTGAGSDPGDSALAVTRVLRGPSGKMFHVEHPAKIIERMSLWPKAGTCFLRTVCLRVFALGS